MTKVHSNGLVLHDFVKVPGGAERLALTLADELKADLVIGFECPDIIRKLGFAGKVVPKSLANHYDSNIRDYISLIKNFRQGLSIPSLLNVSLYFYGSRV